MTFGEQRDRSLAEPPFVLIAQATSGLPVEFAAVGSCTVSGRVVTLVSAGVCQITATQPGDADWDPATPIVRQFDIIDASPPPQIDAGFIPTTVNPGGASTLTLELSHPIGTETATGVGFTATFGLLTPGAVTANTCTTGTLTLVSDVLSYAGGTLDVGDMCEISVGVTAPLTAPSYPTSYFAGAGRLQSDLGESPTIGSSNLLVELASGLAQTITMPGFGPWLLVDGPRPLSAQASSGLPVSFAATGVCTVSGDELVFSGTGQCEVTASQPGDATYAAAPDQVRSFAVRQASQTIDFGPLSDWPLTAGVRTLTATASSGLAVSYSATGACTVTGSDLTPTALGTCTITARQLGDVNYVAAVDVEQSFEVIGGDQTIDFGLLDDWGLFDGPRTLSATATSGLDVSFAAAGPCSVVGNELTVSAVGTCTVTASQPGDATFGPAADVEQSFEVIPGDQTIDFPTLTVWSVLDTTRTLTATASSGLPVAFSATGPCSVTGDQLTITGLGVCQVTASQAGNASYNPAPDEVRGFEIVQALQTIDFPLIDDIGLNETATVAATASSGLPVTYVASGPCSVSGSTVTPTGAGTCTITASQAGDPTYSPSADVVREFEILRPQVQLVVTGPADPTLVGTPATFVVDFPDVAGLPEPTGTFRFQVTGGQSADIDLVGGVATWIVSDLPVDTNEVGGEYLGDVNYAPVAASVEAVHDVITAPLGSPGCRRRWRPGQSVTVEATGFEAGETVTFVFNSDPVTVGAVTSTATGTATLTFPIPDVDPGAHTLTATGANSELQASASTTLQAAPDTTVRPTDPPATDPPVTDPSATVPPTVPATDAPTTVPPRPDMGTELPATGGSGIGTALAWAGVLLAAGVVIVVASRRRRGAGTIGN